MCQVETVCNQWKQYVTSGMARLLTEVMALTWFFIPLMLPLCNCISSLEQRCSFSKINHTCFNSSDCQLKADCSGQRLTKSPQFNESVVQIDLSNNSIQTFPELPRSLLVLDISRNSLQRFSNVSFARLQKLTTLSIAQNKYGIGPLNFPAGIFKCLTSLTYLDLRGSWNDTVYPEDVLSDLVSLITLRINGKPTGFGSIMRKLQALKTLDISGREGNCIIDYFHDGYFQNVNGIEELDISSCHLTNILDGTFSHIRNLTHLDLSYNEELSFSILRNISKDLKNTNIQVLRINKIHCTFGVGTEIYVSDLKEMQNTSLRELYVNSNRLETIQSGTLMYLPRTLEHVSMSDNKLTMGMYALESANLINLRTFDMSQQFNSHDPKDIFSNCNDTRHGYARNRRQFDSAGSLNESRKRLNHLISNWKRDQAFEAYQNTTIDYRHELRFPFPSPFPVPLPQRLEKAYFNMSTLRYPLMKYRIGNTKIREIYAQDNVFYNLQGPLENMEELEILDLSNNFCTNLSTFFFDYLTGLKTLKLNHNILGFSLAEDKKGDTFKHLRDLKHLEMKYNQIQMLPREIFRNLVSLKTLILADNWLRKFKVIVKHMRRLHLLDLSNNQVSELPHGVMRALNKIAKNRNLTVNLTGNPLLCNCENEHFLRWLVTSHIRFGFHENDTCQTRFSKTGRVRMAQGQEFLLQLERNCRSYTAIIVLFSCVFVVLLTVIVCAVIYRYRWKLRYLYYMTKGRYKGYASLKSKPEEGNYEFDAFVSYADEDRQFALHDIMRNVEREGNLKLCFHSRDFIPGFEIAENITNAINKSRKTLCVLSGNYLKSYWCMYELNIGRMESIYSRNGENVLFLVILEDFSSSNIPLNVLDLIEKKSYIEYPNDTEGDVVFWRKLRDTISM